MSLRVSKTFQGILSASPLALEFKQLLTCSSTKLFYQQHIFILINSFSHFNKSLLSLLDEMVREAKITK